MRKQSKLIYTDASEINIDNWVYHIGLERQKTDQALLREACTLAQVAGGEQLTPNGESCLHQGLAMAEILADLNLDDETLAASIIYSATQYADLSLDVVNDHLNSDIAKLITGTRQMDAVHDLHGRLTQKTHLASTIDNLRKMLLAMVDDVRVVFIKLAERLCILRNLAQVSDEEKQRIAQETMDIYAPLANRLGIGHLKWQLEDLSFRYLAPDHYHQLSRGIKDRRLDREQFVEAIKQQLKTALKNSHIEHFKVSGRAKHIYSIHRKMQRKHVPLDQIYDAIAFRILVSDLDECYAALSIVHDLWEPIPSEFDDYIVLPKPNGYRSIHTAVIADYGKFVEIQIRTFDMHSEAELGVAAHWVYKEGGKQQRGYDQKIAWLRQVMDWQKEVTEDKKEDEEIFSQVFEDRLYVFTPNGDVIDLPPGATPLDFAYQIHSELGHRCRGAKINGAIVPLTHVLKTGEKIEILTTKQGHPSRDWLNPHLGYLKTSRAKAKVATWFKKQDYDRNLEDGHGILEKELKRLGVRDVSYEDLAHKLHYKNKEEVFVAIGRGDLRVHNVLLAANLLTTAAAEDKTTQFVEVAKSTSDSMPTDISVEGVGNLLTYLAKCCKPVPGDAIEGYVTIGRGVSIHRDDCANLIERLSLYPDRKLKVVWGSKRMRKYPVDLSILSSERTDLFHEVTGLLANEHIPIISINAVPNKKNNTTVLHLTIEVDSLHPLSRVVSRIAQLPGIINVLRE